MGLPCRPCAVARCKGMGEVNLSRAVVASGLCSGQAPAAAAGRQQGLWMLGDLSQEEWNCACCAEPRAGVRLIPLKLQERAYCGRTGLEIRTPTASRAVIDQLH